MDLSNNAVIDMNSMINEEYKVQHDYQKQCDLRIRELEESIPRRKLTELQSIREQHETSLM